MLLMAFFASQGYAVVATDYLGYALSTYPYHLYMHADTEASSVIDSIRATRNAASSGEMDALVNAGRQPANVYMESIL